MAAAGVNPCALYTVPPRWLLDLAHEHGLCVMVGLPWEQHVAFLDDAARAQRDRRGASRDGVRLCAGHPAILCYAIGNEIPASIVAGTARRGSSASSSGSTRPAKRRTPERSSPTSTTPAPSTSQLPFLDFVCFNVFLESDRPVRGLPRAPPEHRRRPAAAHHRDRPRQPPPRSERRRRALLDWQVRAAFASGCAGAFVFSWTDEWHRGGFDIDDWALRSRRPRPAAEAGARRGRAGVRATLPLRPRPGLAARSRSSSAPTTASATLGRCLEALRALDYPDYEVIVVNDGSTDRTAEIAARVRRPADQHREPRPRCRAQRRARGRDGRDRRLHRRRRLPGPALAVATSAHALPDAPTTPASAARTSPRPDDGDVAECVAERAGRPDPRAALGRESPSTSPAATWPSGSEPLEAIGGFDPQFRIAGDDVDICWRLQERGWTVGFSPGAVVWHHRRELACARYLRQQFEYGKAEALLERKWPERYNRAGHLAWAGRVYGSRAAVPRRRRWKIYYGTWGSGLFQSRLRPRPEHARARCR